MEPQWFAADDSGLPAISDMEGDQTPEKRSKDLEAAGFSSASHPEPDKPEGPFRRLSDPKEREVWYGWYGSVVERKDYAGEVPPEVASKLGELVQAGIYEDIFLRVARNGEVLVVAANGSNEDRREYLVVRWNPDGEETPFTQLQQWTRRRTRMYASLVSVMVLASFVFMLLFLTGQIDYSVYPSIMPLYVILMAFFVIHRRNR